jgi:hypothetical protein
MSLRLCAPAFQYCDGAMTQECDVAMDPRDPPKSVFIRVQTAMDVMDP